MPSLGARTSIAFIDCTHRFGPDHPAITREESPWTRLLEGEKMAVLCREFDISRKTGYKLFSRYKDCGLEGLTDRSRRPYRQANRLPFQVETLIVQLKKEHPTWGAPKIREKIKRRHSEITLPAISTVHAVLDRHGLVTRGRHPRYKAQGTTLSAPTQAND